MYFFVSFFLGSGSNTRQSPVRCGDFPSIHPSVCPSVCLSIHPSPSGPASQASQPASQASQPASLVSQPANQAFQPASEASQLASQASEPASKPGDRQKYGQTDRWRDGWIDGWMDRWMDRQTNGWKDGWMENLPILQDFVTYWGRHPAIPQLQSKNSIKGTSDQMMPLGNWFSPFFFHFFCTSNS